MPSFICMLTNFRISPRFPRAEDVTHLEEYLLSMQGTLGLISRWLMSIILSLERWRQEDHKIKVILAYIVNSRLV